MPLGEKKEIKANKMYQLKMTLVESEESSSKQSASENRVRYLKPHYMGK